jgi:acetyltransferase-like isoleucine patch superfamily enzyme
MYKSKIRNLFRQRGFFGAAGYLSPLSVAFIRGLFRGYAFVFIGRGVKIRHRRKVKIGRFSRIDDFAEIDGFGKYGVRIGNHCKVGKYSIIRVPPTPDIPGIGVSIGDHSTLAEFCFIGGAALVDIKENCSIGQYVSMHPQNHSGPSKSSVTTEIGIFVNSDVWIGAKATLLDGTYVDKNTTVGACALLNKRYASGTVLGVPAKNVTL